MNPLAGIRVKITKKQEIYKHIHTHTHTHNIVQNNLLSGCFCTSIFHKKMQHIETKERARNT